MFCHSWSGTNPPLSLFHLLFRVFMICRYRTKTNPSPPLLPPPSQSSSALTLPPFFPLWLPLLPSDTLLLFTSEHNCIYLSSCSFPCHSLPLLFTSKVILTGEPLEKKKVKAATRHVMFLPKTSYTNRLHLTLCIQELHQKEDDVPCNSVHPPFKQQTLLEQ